MQTPDNEAGRQTEAVMQALVPWDAPHRPSTEKYNRCWEAIYDLLSEVAAVERGGEGR
jgi:hypothetical protein